jgi:hypothetical protein
MKIRRAALWAAFLCALTSAAAAQTAAEKAACRPDALRLCSTDELARAFFGDRTGIYQCFKTHRREMSKPCDRVLKRHGK